MSFHIIYRSGTDEFEEMRYITFRISDSSFEISKGGSVYDCAVGDIFRTGLVRLG